MDYLLISIALLCQTNPGSGFAYTVSHEQQKCQKELAACALKDGYNGASQKKILECLRDRKSE